MTNCPSCNHIDNDLSAIFPEIMCQNMSNFIGLSHMLDSGDFNAFRCVNCGSYIDEITNTVIKTPAELLSPADNSTSIDQWSDLLKIPPDLFRIVANECSLGNRVCGSVRGEGANNWIAFYMDGSFRDGHIVSSWIEHLSQFSNHLDISSYVCDSMRFAVCSQECQAKQVAGYVAPSQ